MSAPHRHPVRIYFEDTDAGGVVYYANYLRFAERARTEMLRELGFESSRLMEESAAVLAVRGVEADYRRPARLDDLLILETSLLALKGASLAFSQIVKRNGETLADMTITLACMSADGRPRRLPEALRGALSPKIASKSPQ